MTTSGQLWNSTPARGHPLHRCCSYQGSFFPPLVAHFLDRYPDAHRILDPFCGRGTVLLEGVLRNKKVFGTDLSPLAVLLSKVKINCDPLPKVLEEIEGLDLDSGRVPEPPADIRPFYHPRTWQEVWRLRQHAKSPTLTAVALGKLHGHSPGFFSTTTFNVISVHGASLVKSSKKHGTKPEYRDVKQLLARAAKKFVPVEGLHGEGWVSQRDARHLPFPDASMDLVITSPPFLDVIDYEDVNWLRLWFIDKQCPQTFIKGLDEYRQFLHDVLKELARIINPTGHIVFEVGPVKKHANMAELVVEASRGSLEVEEVIKHSFADAGVPKISRAMKGGKKTTTMSNHCVVLRRNT